MIPHSDPKIVTRRSGVRPWLKLCQLAFVCLGFLRMVTPITAQTVESVYSFVNGGFTSPRNPRGDLTLGKDGNLYGTTYIGGTGGFGTVFKLTTQGVLTVLANFEPSILGGDPNGGLAIGADGSIYGTTYFFGAGSFGTVFRVAPDGTATVLHSFSQVTYSGNIGSNSDGASPKAGLTFGPDGFLYGVTSQGGPNGSGTIFKMTTGGELTTLFAFDAYKGCPSRNTTGGNPYGRLVFDSRGNIYGTTSGGGTNSGGTLFRLGTNGMFTAFVHFNYINGYAPQSGMVFAPDGNLYGTTENGGSKGAGTLFRLTPEGELTTLVNFEDQTGNSPIGGLTVGPDGNLYGTTSNGGINPPGYTGTAFRMTLGGDLTVLADLTPGIGSDGGLTLGPDGNFYGTSPNGGPNGQESPGIVFRLNPGLDLLPRPTDITWNSGGISLTLAGTDGTTNLLRASADPSLPLSQWQVISTNVASDGSFRFTDPNTGGFQRKFYRFSAP